MEHFQEALLPELHQSINEHMCKIKGKSLMQRYMKNKPINWGFKFWFWYGSKSGYLYQFDMHLGKKSQTEFGLGKSVLLSLCENLKNSNSCNSFKKVLHSFYPFLIIEMFYCNCFNFSSKKNFFNTLHLIQIFFFFSQYFTVL